MSVDAAVDELYGDDKDDAWKKEEIQRIKGELGIAEIEEPGLNLEGVNMIEGENRIQNIPNVPEGVPGATGGGEGTGANGDIRPGNK